ncbi:hypothetical protein MRX96_058046 [Rhipicephalus microplus]
MQKGSVASCAKNGGTTPGSTKNFSSCYATRMIVFITRGVPDKAPPYSQAGYRDGKLYVDGVFGFVLEALADFVPFSYDIVYDQRLSFGVRLPNGTYTGIIGLIQSGTADLAAAPVLVRYDRTEVATYAPILFTSHCVLIAVAGEPGVNAFSYLFVFDWEASQMRLSALV